MIPHCCDCGQAIEGRGVWLKKEVAPNIKVERLVCVACASTFAFTTKEAKP